MTIEQLKKVLRKCAKDKDREGAHSDADEALLEYINDPEVTELFTSQTFWYA